MCDPVTCEKCRNVAGCKEAQAKETAAAGLFDNTAQQVERLALFQKFQGSHEWPASDNLLEVENRALKEGMRKIQDQFRNQHETNIQLADENRRLKAQLRAIQTLSEAWL